MINHAQAFLRPLKSWTSVIPASFSGVWQRKNVKVKNRCAGQEWLEFLMRCHLDAFPFRSGTGEGMSTQPEPETTIAELAVATSLLSYPLTVLHCLGAGPRAPLPPGQGGGTSTKPAAARGPGSAAVDGLMATAVSASSSTPQPAALCQTLGDTVGILASRWI